MPVPVFLVPRLGRGPIDSTRRKLLLSLTWLGVDVKTVPSIALGLPTLDLSATIPCTCGIDFLLALHDYYVHLRWGGAEMSKIDPICDRLSAEEDRVNRWSFAIGVHEAERAGN